MKPTETLLQEFRHDFDWIADAIGESDFKKLENRFLETISSTELRMIKRLRELIMCKECHGSGERSTPSSYDMCSNCDGMGFYTDGSNCREILSLLEPVSEEEVINTPA